MPQHEPFAFVQIPKAFVFWPLVAAAIILSILNWMAPEVITERVMGTVFLPMLVLVCFAAVENFPGPESIVVIGAIALVSAVIALVGVYYQIPILTWILDTFRITKFTINKTFLLAFSSIFLLIFLGYLVDIRIRKIWIAVQGFLIRKILLKKPQEQPIGANEFSVKEDYSDMMDGIILGVLGFLLGKGFGLAGDIVVMDRDKKEVMRIHMVFKAKKLAERIHPFQALPTQDQRGHGAGTGTLTPPVAP